MHSYVILCEESNGHVCLLIAIIFHELSVVAKHMFWTTYVAQNHKEIRSMILTFTEAKAEEAYYFFLSICDALSEHNWPMAYPSIKCSPMI